MTAKLFTGSIPEEYDPVFIQELLINLQNFIENLEIPYIILTLQHKEPDKLIEGMVVGADGTNWNPTGGGAGLYQYISGSWNKL